MQYFFLHFIKLLSFWVSYSSFWVLAKNPVSLFLPLCKGAVTKWLGIFVILNVSKEFLPFLKGIRRSRGDFPSHLTHHPERSEGFSLSFFCPFVKGLSRQWLGIFVILSVSEESYVYITAQISRPLSTIFKKRERKKNVNSFLLF